MSFSFVHHLLVTFQNVPEWYDHAEAPLISEYCGIVVDWWAVTFVCCDVLHGGVDSGG